MEELSFLLFSFIGWGGNIVHSSGRPGENIRTKENEYRITDSDESVTTPRYYGYIDEVGSWLILKISISGGLKAYRYARASFASTGTYSLNWDARATLQYGYWDERW